MLTVGGLFSGIGGWELGLERAGMRVLWHCESEPFPRAVLEHRWPGVPCYSDVRELRGADVEPVDVLCGGFPCQDLSYAGAGAGIDGERSGLWSEYARLVGELRPRYVLVENVAALLARGLGRVLGDLAALGYDAEWDCLPASAFGAPHRRDRVWLVAYPQVESEWAGLRADGAGTQRGGRPGNSRGARGMADPERGGREGWSHLTRRDDSERDAPERSQGAGDLARSGAPARALGNAKGDGRGSGREGRPHPTGAGQRQPERTLQDADSSTLQQWRVGGRAAQAGGAEWWAAEPPVGRVAHGVPDRLDQLAALGNALVPQIAEWIGRRITAFEEGRHAA